MHKILDVLYFKSYFDNDSFPKTDKKMNVMNVLSTKKKLPKANCS